MKMSTYVNFAGTCAEAFRFYEKHLGGKIGMMMTHAEAPDQSKVNPDWKDAILHARLSLGGTELMGADIPRAEPMRSAYLSLGVESDAEAERIFAALSEGGQVFMPMHYPEVNRLTHPSFDPHSRQPNYKHCAVSVQLDCRGGHR